MTKTNAKLLLLSVFIARGTSFMFSKYLLESMTPESILAVRFLTAFAVLAVIFRRKLLSCSLQSLKGGIILGLLYTLCMAFEMYGLKTVDSGVSAFIENMAIILVPLYVALMTRTLPRKKTMFCAFLAIAGVGFLSLSQSTGTGIPSGIILVILAALTYGFCILYTDYAAQHADPLTVGMIQLGVMGLVNLVLSLFMQNFALPRTGREWGMILMLALVCSSFGFTFQPVAQKYLSAETAAVFTVVNPLTASVLGVLIEGEAMGWAKAAGYVMILIALIIYNLQRKSLPQKT